MKVIETDRLYFLNSLAEFKKKKNPVTDFANGTHVKGTTTTKKRVLKTKTQKMFLSGKC